MTAQPRPEQATGFTVEPNSKANEYTLNVSIDTGRTAVTVACDGAAALAALLVMRVSHSQTADAHRALQSFAMRSISTEATPDGGRYVEYALENGLRFASRFSANELRSPQAIIGEELARTPES